MQGIKAYGGIELKILSFFISVPDRVEWSDSLAGCFIAVQDPRGLRAGLKAFKKRRAFRSCREARHNSPIFLARRPVSILTALSQPWHKWKHAYMNPIYLWSSSSRIIKHFRINFIYQGETILVRIQSPQSGNVSLINSSMGQMLKHVLLAYILLWPFSFVFSVFVTGH